MTSHRYYVYHNFGSCNDGSHDCDMEECDTLGEALAYRERIIARNRGEEGEVAIIRGRAVTPEEIVTN